MQEQKARPLGPAQWRIEPLKGDTVAFDCPACHAKYAFDAAAFKDKPAQGVEGLTKTNQVVRRAGGQNLLALVVGVVVFIWVHRTIFGPVIQVGTHLIVPSFAAVLAYHLANFLFQGLSISGKGIPIFRLECGQCQSEVLIASNGRSLALPMKGPETNAPIEAEGSRATNAVQGSSGSGESKKAGEASPGDQAPASMKSSEPLAAKAPEPKLPRLRVSRSAVKAMARDRDVEQLVQVAKRGGLFAQLAAAKALLEIDDVAGLDELLNDTVFGRYYERAVSQLESHGSEPRAVEALRRAAAHEPSGPGELGVTVNKTRRLAAAKALDRLGQHGSFDGGPH